MRVHCSFHAAIIPFRHPGSTVAPLLVSAIVLLSLTLSAQTLLLKNYTTRDGLPDSRIAPILQDRQGYIWLGAQAGLARYDGKDFVNFGPAREIPGIFGRSILEDHAGSIWFAYSGFSHGGITRIGSSVTIDCTNGLKGSQVAEVAEDRNHDIWAATSAGLEEIHFTDSSRSKWTVQTFADSAMMMVHADADGRIWFAGSRGLFTIDDGRFVPFYRTPPGNNNWQVRAYSFYRAHDGSLWLGSYHGAYRLEGNRLRLYSVRDGLPERGTWCFREDIDGTFFAGTMNGLYRIEASGHAFRFRKDPSFGDAVVYDMCLDREANLWFASAPGLRRLIRSAEILDFPGRIDLANAGIGPIAQESGRTLFFGSRNAGLYSIDGTKFRHIATAGTFMTRTITTILPRHSRLWLGLWRTGVCVIEGDNATMYSVKSGLPSDNVHSLAALPDGGILAGTAEGVAVIRGNGSIPGEERTLRGNVVFDLKRGGYARLSPSEPGEERESPDTIWAGTNDGVRALLVQPESVVAASPGAIEHETAGRIVYEVLVDTRRRLWCGTDGAGVVMRDEKGISHFTKEDGLAGDRVFALAEDSIGNIWVGTSSGLSCYNGHGFRNLGYDEGFGEIGVHGLLVDREGFLWVSAYPGVRKLRPAHYAASGEAPPLYLTDVQVESRHVSPRESCELPPDPAVITFRFAALSYTDERCVRYRYRLDGFDPEWSQPEVSREVRYTHLPSGLYTFRVIGRSGDGVWNETPAAFTFSILPPVWARWWFIAGATLLVLLSAYALYRYRLERLLELERTRNRIAMDLHDDIGSSLTRISIMTEVAGRQSGTDPEKARGVLAAVGETARDLIESLGDIVWTVDPKQDTLQNVIRRISQFGEEMCEGRGIVFETDLSGSFESARLTPERRRDVYLVFKEGIHNIVKHSGATRARFSVRPLPHGAVLDLVDDGKGIPHGVGETGHGLTSLRERGERVGVRFVLSSEYGKGTHLQLEVKTG